VRRLLGFALCVLALPPTAVRADGALVIGDRTLQRRGDAARHYCAEEDEECEQALLRVLSGYGYLPGTLSAGVSMQGALLAAAMELRLAVVGAAAPGGELKLGAADLWFDGGFRLRGTMLDARSMFFCHDSQRGGLHAPLFGHMTRACSPDAVVGVELGLLDAQWDPGSSRTAVEWVRTGLAFELFGNGHAHSHMLRSLTLAPLVDLRSLRYGSTRVDVAPDGPSGRFGVGAGMRLGWLWRSPRWETALDARYRVDLLQLDAATPDHQLGAELRLLYNFFLSDAIVAQVGLRLAYHHAQQPLDSFGTPASTYVRDSGFVGAVLGWKHEPPAI
jgi:hypothetical protein